MDGSCSGHYDASWWLSPVVGSISTIKFSTGTATAFNSFGLQSHTPDSALALTRGRRDVAVLVLWVQSLVREAGQRRALYELDCAIRSLRERAPESPEILSLTGVYHNLLRAAAEL